MFLASKAFKPMAVCMMMMMVIMVAVRESAAMPRNHPVKGGVQSRQNHNTAAHKKPSEDPDTSEEMVPLQLDTAALRPKSSHRALWNHSISPWTYNNTYDDSLFPMVISEARCTLQGCLDDQGVEDLSLESKPILHQIMVLRRVLSSRPEGKNNYHYRLETKVVSVGCTCVRPSIRHQNN